MIVERKQYSKVITFRPGEAVLRNMRTRLENVLTSEDNSTNNVEDSANCRAAKQKKQFQILLRILKQKKQDKQQMM